ncbi:DUF5993 family protein [Catelliglobosispora koreensis]|uniref:DUF5993 family protein n=1 Tax=Catelliglobosispora koreensis TaxID=129052 RepID=UPI00037EB685|nr:DUF5993 family protein [Catelliglobosispora koreensis]
MDTLIFGLLLYTGWVTYRGKSRRLILILWTVSLAAVLWLLSHHITSKLPLNF